jgi:serine/threonine protein kinase
MSTTDRPNGLDDLLDQLVGEYSDLVAGGATPPHAGFLERVPADARPGLERCLKMIDAGMAQAPTAAQPLAAGSRFGRYELLREVGRGGMAVVWLGRDTELQRPVALKVLRPGLALEERHVDRFRREALAIAKLQHPHIVRIYDVGEDRGYHYLAMEYVEGPSLATVLDALPADHGWSSDDLARATGIPSVGEPGKTYEQAVGALLAPVAEALHTAHEHGLVHRDVKPSNILLRSDGTAVVADFGLAKGENDPALSMTGDTLGTPFYMSPEQAWLTETTVDHRTDVYSLGVTLYEALSGERPFDGRNVLEVFEKIKTSVPASLRSVESRASKNAAAVVQRAMARDPEDRYATAEMLLADLEALSLGATTVARQDLGNFLQRWWTQMRFYCSGHPYEFRSRTTFLGLPLAHLISGRRLPGQPMRRAVGWIAIGDVAFGGIAIGAISAGGIACGGMAAGVLGSWGGLSAAVLVPIGGIAIGMFPCGGLALGYLAFGGVALGYGAVGGFARGTYAMGGNAEGEYVIREGREDLPHQDWFEGVFGRLTQLFGVEA